MADVCRRDPWGLRRLLRQHEGETGLVVYGWFKRLIYWPEAKGWELVAIVIKDKRQAVLQESKRDPVWLPLAPGHHTIHFDGLWGRLHSENLSLVEGEQVLVAFRPALWLPFRRPRPPQWCVRQLTG